MSLKTKIILTLAGVFLAAGVSSVFVNNEVILPSFAALERDEAEKNSNRVVEAINQEIQGLASAVSTWGWWDDAYRYVQDGNADFAKTNLTAEALTGPQVSYIAVYDRKGRKIGSGTAAADANTALELGELAESGLPANHPLFRHAGPRSGIGGLLGGPQQPLLVVSWPILKSNGEGTIQGSVLMVRPLDPGMLARLAARTKLKIAIVPSPLAAAPVDPSAESDGLVLGHSSFRNTTLTDRVESAAELYDVHGRPLLQLTVDTARDISARGRTAVTFALMNLTAAALLLFAVLFLVIRQTLFRPLARLTAHVEAVGSNGDLSNRLNLLRKDELGTLAFEFDRMSDRLVEARNRLAEQSFDSGRADMAAGILHNLGNAVTPLTVRLAQLHTDLCSAPLEHIQRALTELTTGAVAPQRRLDLEKFLYLATAELLRIVGLATAQVDSSVVQLHHVQQILNDQERFSRSRQRLEPVDLSKVLQQSYTEMSPKLQDRIKLELQPGVAQVGRVMGSWVAIRQVVSNLLINSAEAIAAQPPGTGIVKVQCKIESTAHGLAVHTSVTDNGIGIPEDHLQKIFAARYSTKERGSGDGLHWCANAVNAMRGQLYAESHGVGKGASFHLVLPADTAALQMERVG